MDDLINEKKSPNLHLINATTSPDRANNHKDADVLIYVVNLSKNDNNLASIESDITAALRVMNPSTKLVLVGTHPGWPADNSKNTKLLRTLQNRFIDRTSQIVPAFNIPSRGKEEEIGKFLDQLYRFAEEKPAPRAQMQKPIPPSAPSSSTSPRSTQSDPRAEEKEAVTLTRHKYPKSYGEMWSRTDNLRHLSEDERKFHSACIILNDYALQTSAKASKLTQWGQFFRHPKRQHTELINTFLEKYEGPKTVGALLENLQEALEKEMVKPFNKKGSLARRMDYIEERCGMTVENDTKIIDHEKIINAWEARAAGQEVERKDSLR